MRALFDDGEAAARRSAGAGRSHTRIPGTTAPIGPTTTPNETGPSRRQRRAQGQARAPPRAYDRRYHFPDPSTGREVRPPLLTGDLAKGSATSKPDGFPLYYGGSRDNSLRVVALDRRRPTVVWKLDSYAGGPVWRGRAYLGSRGGALHALAARR